MSPNTVKIPPYSIESPTSEGFIEPVWNLTYFQMIVANPAKEQMIEISFRCLLFLRTKNENTITKADTKTTQKIPPSSAPEARVTPKQDSLIQGRKKQIKAIPAPIGLMSGFFSFINSTFSSSRAFPCAAGRWSGPGRSRTGPKRPRWRSPCSGRRIPFRRCSKR